MNVVPHILLVLLLLLLLIHKLFSNYKDIFSTSKLYGYSWIRWLICKWVDTQSNFNGNFSPIQERELNLCYFSIDFLQRPKVFDLKITFEKMSSSRISVLIFFLQITCSIIKNASIIIFWFHGQIIIFITNS